MFPQSNNFITGGTFTLTQFNEVKRGPHERLVGASSPFAFHNSGERRNPPKCHPKTREAVQEKFVNWIFGLDPETKNAMIIWLYGAAGAGKSAIAQTIAERCHEEQTLLASYFFSRFDPTRNHARSLIASIAYQVSSHFPSAQELILNAIRIDPLIFTRSLLAQAFALIIEPLQRLTTSGFFSDHASRRVVITDGLDECEDREGQVDILLTISHLLQHDHLPLLFIITSRPEHEITYNFDTGYLRDVCFRIHLNDRFAADADIRLFLQDKFTDIKRSHPLKAHIPEYWPTRYVLDSLVKKSSGQFIYASTVMKFVGSTRHRPTDRLDIINGIRLPLTSRDVPFAEIDALYHHIFSSVEDLDATLQILAFQILSKPYIYSVAFIEEILSLRPGDIRLLLFDMASLVDIRTGLHGTSQSLAFHHASLEDFLLDERRSKNLCIRAPVWREQFARMVLRYIKTVAVFDDAQMTISSLLLSHLRLAPPAASLRDEIQSLDIVHFIKGPNFHLFTTGWFVSEMSKAIRESKFEDAHELDCHFIDTFDRFAKSQLQIYYSDPALTSLAVFTTFSIYTYWRDNLSYECLFYPDNRSRVIDLSGLRLLDCLGKNGYRQFFTEFLLDAKRSREHALNGDRFTTAAMYLLERTCDHALQWKRPHRGSLFRKNRPWRWHQKTKWLRSAFQRKRNRQKKTMWYRNTVWTPFYNQASVPPIQETKAGRAFHLALQGLTPVLRKAGPSDELVKFARRYAFGPMVQAFPEDGHGARKAIRHYLKRMYFSTA